MSGAAKKRGKVLHRGKSLHSQDVVVSKETLARDVSAIVLRLPTKQVASAAQCTVEATKKWRAGHNAPTLAHAINAARQIPELRSLLVGLMQPQEEGSPFEAHVANAFLAGLSAAASSNSRVQALLNEVARIMHENGGKE